mmetsp:Transcript_24655/g.84383  ORF Transcript_24655/g.84383 Transcript_24655/m.84383 type:complete len:121 (-) Transcript_24655:2357-2719(-)
MAHSPTGRASREECTVPIRIRAVLLGCRFRCKGGPSRRANCARLEERSLRPSKRQRDGRIARGADFEEYDAKWPLKKTHNPKGQKAKRPKDPTARPNRTEAALVSLAKKCEPEFSKMGSF